MNEEARMLRVGTHRVGIVGLQEIFEEMKGQVVQTDEHLRKELVQRVKKRNYIPPSIENKCC